MIQRLEQVAAEQQTVKQWQETLRTAYRANKANDAAMEEFARHYT